LQGYDYSGGGCYYVTICTQDRICLFGKVLHGKMYLNGYGGIACEEWYRSAELRDELMLDAFGVMPNHVHGLVFIDGQKGDPPVAPTLPNGPRPRSLGSFIAGYKSSVTWRVSRAPTGVGATGGSPSAGYAVHMLEDGATIREVQELLGHTSVKSTTLYLKFLAPLRARSPLTFPRLPRAATQTLAKETGTWRRVVRRPPHVESCPGASGEPTPATSPGMGARSQDGLWSRFASARDWRTQRVIGNRHWPSAPP
jgi:hypothetical protein